MLPPTLEGRLPLFKSFSVVASSSAPCSTLDAGDLLRDGRLPLLTTLPVLERRGCGCSGAETGDLLRDGRRALIITFPLALSMASLVDAGDLLRERFAALNLVSDCSETKPRESSRFFSMDLRWERSEPGDSLSGLCFKMDRGAECSDPDPGDRLLERDRKDALGSEPSESDTGER